MQGLTVAELQEFRRALPEDAKLIVSKNSLIKIAAKEVEGWSGLAETAKGDSAILFVGESVKEAAKVRHHDLRFPPSCAAVARVPARRQQAP